jgi:hypothetical protein
MQYNHNQPLFARDTVAALACVTVYSEHNLQKKENTEIKLEFPD